MQICKYEPSILSVSILVLYTFVTATAQPAKVLHQTAGIDPKLKKTKKIS
jgi:hypothetical protein